MNHRPTLNIDTRIDTKSFCSLKEKFCHELEMGLKLYSESSQWTLPHQKTLAQRDIPLHRVKEGYGVTYISALALKLEKIGAQRAIDIASHLAADMVTTPDFTVTVLPNAWIHLQLTPNGVAQWLQSLCDSPEGEEVRSWALAQKTTESEGEEVRSWASAQKTTESEGEEVRSWALAQKTTESEGEEVRSWALAQKTTESEGEEVRSWALAQKTTKRQGDGGKGGDKDRQLFQLQYAHARCCSLLRLAHREGLISLVVAASGDLTTEETFPWLDGEGNLQFSHPAEMAVISQLAGSLDGLWDLHQGGKRTSLLPLALGLSEDLLKFYARCRIFGEVKAENLALAKARSGLVMAGRQVLKILLEKNLGVLAPLEL